MLGGESSFIGTDRATTAGHGPNPAEAGGNVAMRAAKARVLEIGEYFFLKDEVPAQSDLLFTGWRRFRKLARYQYSDCTPVRFFRAWRDVRAGKYDFVVVYLSQASPMHPRYWLRALAREPLKPWSALTRVFGTRWLRLVPCPVPLIVVDMHDSFVIGRNSLFLLDKADVVFKRELPADRWQVFSDFLRPAPPSRRIRLQRKWQQRVAKISPLTLPTRVVDTAPLWDGDFPEKTTDIFFAGNAMENSWVRRTGIGELTALESRGFRVDIPEKPLPREEFYRRLSRAWLAWSPAGFGWECNRTAEAAQCLTVPVVNVPTIERHRPLQDGEHAVFYSVEPGGLTRAVETALADKEHLKTMAVAARSHVLAHHTTTAIAAFLIETGLALAKPRGGEGVAPPIT